MWKGFNIYLGLVWGGGDHFLQECRSSLLFVFFVSLHGQGFERMPRFHANNFVYCWQMAYVQSGSYKENRKWEERGDYCAICKVNDEFTHKNFVDSKKVVLNQKKCSSEAVHPTLQNNSMACRPCWDLLHSTAEPSSLQSMLRISNCSLLVMLKLFLHYFLTDILCHFAVMVISTTKHVRKWAQIIVWWRKWISLCTMYKVYWRGQLA